MKDNVYAWLHNRVWKHLWKLHKSAHGFNWDNSVLVASVVCTLQIHKLTVERVGHPKSESNYVYPCHGFLIHGPIRFRDSIGFVLNAETWFGEMITKLIFRLRSFRCCEIWDMRHCGFNFSAVSGIWNNRFPVGHGGPHDDSSRAGYGPQAGRCALLIYACILNQSGFHSQIQKAWLFWFATVVNSKLRTVIFNYEVLLRKLYPCTEMYDRIIIRRKRCCIICTMVQDIGLQLIVIR